ncbi:MAG: DHH family phosphoesterase, partial [Oscillospiraceae bacterium]|nr:DHH family phosphoesterase [Oscillospiraceae bacterium]
MPPKLSELVTLLKGHRVFIQTHNFPDPDAIASAFGLQVLLWRFNIATTICHHGNIERTATANMVAEFGIQMTTDDDLKDMRPDDYIITVDSQKGNANILDLVGDEVACIDHHPTFV